MQLRLNFQEGLLYHQETLNFEYPTHLANYYLPTYLDLWATRRGEKCAPLLWRWWGGGHLVLTDYIYQLWGKYNIIFLGFFSLFPSSSQWVLNMFLKFPICSLTCSQYHLTLSHMLCSRVYGLGNLGMVLGTYLEYIIIFL
jgi:hypothetical protein